MTQTINRKRIVLNTFFLYAKTLITMIISFVSTRLVLDGLGTTDYGIYGTVGGAIVMLETLNIAMTQATQRFMNYAEGKGERDHLLFIFNNTVLLHLGLGVIVIFLMFLLYFPLFGGVFNIPVERMEAAKFIYFFLALSAFFSIITVPYDALINAHENFLYYSIAGIVVAFLKLGAALLVVHFMSDRLILYGLLMATIAVLNMLIMRVFCRFKYEECRFAPRKYASAATAKEIGVFAGWNFVGAFANMAGNHGSTILMNHFFGPILIAAKNIGDQICAQVAILTSNMTKALNPVIVKSEGSGDRKTMVELSYKSCRFSFLLYLVLAIPFMYNTEPLLAIWLKEVPDWAVLFCQLQVTRTLFEQLFTPLRLSLMAQGSVRQINLADLVLGVMTFFILWYLYKLGFAAQWHYYISIVILVFISGAIKVYLSGKLCDMQFLDYLHKVIIPCMAVLILSIFLGAGVHLLLNQCNVLIIVFLQVVVLFLIGIFFGLSQSERSLLLSNIHIISRNK